MKWRGGGGNFYPRISIVNDRMVPATWWVGKLIVRQ